MFVTPEVYVISDIDMWLLAYLITEHSLDAPLCNVLHVFLNSCYRRCILDSLHDFWLFAVKPY